MKFVSSVFRWLRARCRRTLRRNGECAYGKTVWSWPSLLRSSFRGGVCEPNRADSIIQFARRGRPEGTRLPGEHGISRPTIAQGRPSDWLHLYAAVRFSCVCFSRSGPRVPAGTRPSLRPLGQEGEATKQSSGEISREAAKLCLLQKCELEAWRCRLMLRHCERSEAIQKCIRGECLDCFVARAPRNGDVEAVSLDRARLPASPSRWCRHRAVGIARPVGLGPL